MRLLHKLMQHRDAALATAGKYSELIALLEGDTDLANIGANGNGHAPEKKRNNWSAAKRKANSLRMKKLWKERRATMMKGVKKGAAARVASHKQRAAEA